MDNKEKLAKARVALAVSSAPIQKKFHWNQFSQANKDKALERLAKMSPPAAEATKKVSYLCIKKQSWKVEIGVLTMCEYKKRFDFRSWRSCRTSRRTPSPSRLPFVSEKNSAKKNLTNVSH